jgi:DNA-binding IclR family transcriptional regulator
MQKERKEMSEKPKYSAPAVDKVLTIIECMANQNKPFTVTELATITHNSVNSVFRIMIELENKNYVTKNQIDSRYALTSKLYFLGNSLKDRINLIDETKEAMEKVKTLTKETVLLTQLDAKSNTLIIDQLESPLPIKFLSTIGVAYDSYSSAMGKCMLAFTSELQIDEYINTTLFEPRTSTTITDKETFKEELKEIRASGIAYDNAESVEGLTCVACPLLSSSNSIMGSIGISAISFRVTPIILKGFAKTLYEICKELSTRFGCTHYPKSF